MCFSAEADLVAGLVVIGLGVDATRHTSQRSELPVAALPLLLGAHQLVEALVWLGLESRVPEVAYRSATWAYLLIACVVLPVYVPVALFMFDPAPRRRWLLGFLAVGGAVSLLLLRDVVSGPVVARIEGRHIEYGIGVWQLGIVVGLYVMATCGPLLVARARQVRWFGAANVVVAGFLAWLDNSAFVSLWCVWAAIGSISIAVHLRGSRPNGVGDSGPHGRWLEASSPRFVMSARKRSK